VYKVTILRTLGAYVYTSVISCYHYVRLRRKSDGERGRGREGGREEGREGGREGGRAEIAAERRGERARAREGRER
jgi:hypothetical protein